jgi:5-methylcytosine-specific restriction protein A
MDNNPSDIHHRRPRRMGGTLDPEINSPANLVLLCRACHSDIESHRQQALTDGWLLYSTANPEQQPVSIRGLGLVNLTKNGAYHMHPQGH